MTKEGLRLSRIGLCGYLHGFPARPLWCSSDSYSTTESSSILKTDDPTLVSLWFFAFLTILHFSTWFLILPYILVPWLPSCFLHPRGLSSPAYVLCWCPFFWFLFPHSSFFFSPESLLFLPRVPPFSPHHLPSSFSSTPCSLCPCLRITSVIRRWSSTLIIWVLMCFWSAILDQLSPLTSDIAHHLSFSYVRFISYLLTPPIWSRPARSVLLTTWSEGRIIDRITAFSPNYQY